MITYCADNSLIHAKIATKIDYQISIANECFSKIELKLCQFLLNWKELQSPLMSHLSMH